MEAAHSRRSAISTLREDLVHRLCHADEERVVWLADPLTPRDLPDGSLRPSGDTRPRKLRPGDPLLVDTKAGYAKRIPKAEVEDLLEECRTSATPTSAVRAARREQIRDAGAAVPAQGVAPGVRARPAVCCSMAHPAVVRRWIASAVANSLAKKMGRGPRNDAHEAKSYSSTSRPRAAEQIVGETELHPADLPTAREKASEGTR